VWLDGCVLAGSQTHAQHSLQERRPLSAHHAVSTDERMQVLVQGIWHACMVGAQQRAGRKKQASAWQHMRMRHGMHAT
jgi:hypothetical protein